jgi:hypothetical protein
VRKTLDILGMVLVVPHQALKILNHANKRSTFP